MRTLVTWVGNLLVLGALAGLAFLVLGSATTLPAPAGASVVERSGHAEAVDAPARDGAAAARAAAARPFSSVEAGAAATLTPSTPAPSAVSAAPQVVAAPLAVAERLPITRVVMARLGLDAEAVPARLVHQGGALTWEVPAFRAGHAEGTAGAGQLGNAVLFGHVESRNAGNVFHALDRTRAGDVVEIFSGDRRFAYRVVEAGSVPRTDTAAVESTDTPSVTLITCTGLWLPTIWDFTERLVVRGELVGADPS